MTSREDRLPNALGNSTLWRGTAVIIGAFLLLEILFGLTFATTIGQQVFGSPSDRASGALDIPLPHVGDFGLYTTATSPRTEDGLVLPSQEQPLLQFGWLQDRRTPGSSGTFQATNTLAYGGGQDVEQIGNPFFDREQQQNFLRLSFAAGSQELLGWTFESRSEVQDDWPPEGVQSLGILNTPQREQQTNSLVANTILTLPQEREAILLCGLRTALQGSSIDLSKPHSLFERCTLHPPLIRHQTPLGEAELKSSYLEWRIDPELESPRFMAVGQAKVGPYQSIVFESTTIPGAGDLQGAPEARVRVWMAAEIPYPLRIEFEDSTRPSQVEVTRLAAFARGSIPIGVEAIPPLPMAAPVPVARRTWSLDETGVPHPFPLSEGFQLVLEHPVYPALRDHLAAHPQSAMYAAAYRETLGVDSSERLWTFEMSDGTETAYGWVSRGRQTSPDSVVRTGLVEYPSPVGHDWPRSYRKAGSTNVGGVPSELPSLQSLAARWKAVASDGFRDQPVNAWNFQLAPCSGCEAFEPTISVGIERFVSKNSTSDAAVQPSTMEYETSRAIFNARGQLLSLRESTITWNSSTFAFDSLTVFKNSKEEQVTSSSMGAAIPGQGHWWVTPSLPQVLLGGLVAVVVGVAYWGWSNLRTAVWFSGYARLSRTRILQHPVRSRIVQAIHGEPGVGLPDLRSKGKFNRSTLWHHLRSLRLHGEVRATKIQGVWRFFPAHHDVASAGLRILLETDPPLRTLLVMLGTEGSLPAQRALRGLRAELHLTESGAWKVVRRAARHRLIVKQRRGRQVHLRLSQALPAPRPGVVAEPGPVALSGKRQAPAGPMDVEDAAQLPS